MKYIIGTSFLVLALFSSCNKTEKVAEQETVEKQKIDTLTSIPSEMYQGIIPCADCEGIFTTITLAPDQTFDKADYYLGKNEYFIEEGSYTVDASTGIYALSSNNDKATQYYQREEGKLVLLNDKKEKNTGANAHTYELEQLSNDDYHFTPTPVEGFLTIGHEVSSFRPANSAKVYWIEDPSGELQKRYEAIVKDKKTPYFPIKANLVLEKDTKKAEGFAEDYDGVVVVKKLLDLKLISVGN
ncbi:copper resistance protein NlpE [Riemerella anatipestifer]|uniref:copper resistance protein NlpE n=1 Tax=Riemerella anatipestifer TaxID=34085 RepID=UPI000D687320|nr:copper resistance protein NlpE [Riemerella anatipestifer]MCU7541727.1 copper resistance protein NlpE N-terminal domain-containing protein [Riemerella anatipestifer]MCW0512369.1 copper resistance protein NlpE N-terminal domain-containing protein [Riemerella anatipestifer]MRM85552.1 copper resistance protein NlpE [Riemerella anatipestifer]MRM94585.1 copper resistance protein NlpE [Riemerella anatipestifer]MRM96209.1 copper resistance protein NlpE [Riemerella anatipestifer]